MLFIEKVTKELTEARGRFHDFNSYHEGYAVLKEEVDELWEAIKGDVDPGIIEDEAVQVAAMALRFLYDCCAPHETGEGKES